MSIPVLSFASWKDRTGSQVLGIQLEEDNPSPESLTYRSRADTQECITILTRGTKEMYGAS